MSTIPYELTLIPSGALLAVGSVNWDYILEINPKTAGGYGPNRNDVVGESRSVRYVAKTGPQYAGCQSGSFGSLAYWINHGKDRTDTAAGAAFSVQPFSVLHALGSAW